MNFSLKSRTSTTLLSIVFSVVMAASQNLNIDELIECSRIKDQTMLYDLLKERGFQEKVLEDGSTAFVSGEDLNKCPDQVNVRSGNHMGSISIYTCDARYFETLTEELKSSLLGFQETDQRPHEFREAKVISYKSPKFTDLLVRVTDAVVFENEVSGAADEYRRFELEITNFSELH